MQNINYGDQAVFAQAVMDMRETLFRVAYSIVRNHADCEDAVSEALVKAFENVGQLRDTGLFKPWLIRILKNECFLVLRRRKRAIPTEHLPQSADSADLETDIDLHRALGALKSDYALTLTLFYVERYTIEEIAYIMQTTGGTVKSRLSRGRKMLKAQLQKGGARR